MMNRTILASISLALVAALAASGCTGATADAESDEAPQPAVSSNVEASRAPAAQRLEQAQRAVDVGEGKPAAADLAALRADPTATPEQRDQAALSLSRAQAAGGDEDAAATTLEELLAQHGNERDWALGETVESTLRKLVAGVDTAPRSQRARSDEAPTSPFARVLTQFFPESGGKVEVRELLYGGIGEVSERLGTFNVARAVRDMRQEACPLCDVSSNGGTHTSRYSDWMGMHKAGKERAQALNVFYFALDGRKVPARYDAELPMPSADIEARLARGEGVLAAKMREGAPPTIVIGAPRGAQLAIVEAALAQMKALPLEPASVPVPSGLTSEEVKDVVQASRKDQRACYEELLTRAPDAAGRLTLKLALGEDGAVTDVTSEATSAVRDAGFSACMEGVAKKLQFPSTGTRGSVVFPVQLARGTK